jgi:deoxyribodipyrimidine photo-lyase
MCKKFKRNFLAFDDVLLNKPGSVLTNQGTPYTVFTSFYKKALKKTIKKPLHVPKASFYKKEIDIKKIDLSKELTEKAAILKVRNPHCAVRGGRREGAQFIKHVSHLKNYSKTHDFPSLQTSMLSAYIKFGVYSIREIYYTIHDILGTHHPLIRQLYWRDFFYHVAYFFPHVFGHAFSKKYDTLPWSYNKKHFERWCNGLTGFPIVDAGMRQLNKTGFMHNRVRMIVASFLVKDLHIDWQAGEQYFAQHLVDYDPCVNNGNWQWCASTGSDAQPYFRIFNPWLQQAKFDPDAEYIKNWIPELKDIPAKVLHNLYKNSVKLKNYPTPMVDHAKEVEIAKQIYRKYAKK